MHCTCRDTCPEFPHVNLPATSSSRLNSLSSSDDHCQHGLHNWLAPEIFAGNAATVKSDLYSLCTVMWEVIHGTDTRYLSYAHVCHGFRWSSLKKSCMDLSIFMILKRMEYKKNLAKIGSSRKKVDLLILHE